MTEPRFQTVSFLLGKNNLEELSPLWQDHMAGLWQDKERVYVYLPADLDPTTLTEKLKKSGLTGIQVDAVQELDWVARYQATLRPMPLGKRFLIIPDGKSVEPSTPGDRARIPILLEPGQAFGTGDHASTAYCLEALESTLKPQDTVLDVGTGSGILAIAAAKLGASSVTGVDIDALSIEIAKQNATLNQVTLDLRDGDLFAAEPGPYQLILANILAEPLIELMADLEKRLSPGGTLILAGIMREKASAVRAAAFTTGLIQLDESSSPEWTGLTFSKP